MTKLTQEEGNLQLYKQPRFKLLLFSQLISILYFGGSSLTSTLHSSFNFSAPNFTAFCIYSALSLFLIPVYRRRRQQSSNVLNDKGLDFDKSHNEILSCQYTSSFLNFIPIHGNWKAYMLIGVIDYAGMVTYIAALKYTSLASFTLIYSTITPFTMLFSKCFLIRRYTYRHYVGVLVCVVGVVTHALSEGCGGSTNKENGEQCYEVYPNKTVGYTFTLLGASFYGLLDVLCEYSLKSYDGGTSEYLGVTAFFGATISLIPALVWEHEQIITLITDTINGSSGVALVLLILVISEVGGYYYTSRFLESSESTLLNLLTKLTVDILSVLFSIFFQSIVLAPQYFVSLFLTIISVVIYETSESPIPRDTTDNEVLIELPKYEMIPTLLVSESDEDSLMTIVNDTALSC